MAHYVGLDVSVQETAVCVVDRERTVDGWNGSVAAARDGLILEPLPLSGRPAHQHVVCTNVSHDECPQWGDGVDAVNVTVTFPISGGVKFPTFTVRRVRR